MAVDQPFPRRSAPQSSTEVKQPLVMIWFEDHDPSVREALSELILSAGCMPMCFASTRELLDADDLDRPGRLIFDVRMPGSSGLDLQYHLPKTAIPSRSFS